MFNMTVHRSGEYMSVSATGLWVTGSAQVRAKDVKVQWIATDVMAESSLLSCARSMAGQMWAKVSDDLRRDFIHMAEAALREALPRGLSARDPLLPLSVMVGRSDTGDYAITLTPPLGGDADNRKAE